MPLSSRARSRPLARAGGAVGLLALALVGAAVAAGDPLEAARVATSGNDSELRRTIPVADRRGEGWKVAVSLAPRKLPGLQQGDVLQLSAELETTNDCFHRAPHCIGEPYDYSPTISSRLLLASGRRQTGGPAALPLTPTRSRRCTQRLPNREHHCVTVFSGESFVVPAPQMLPCAPQDCRVNLAVRAHSRRADPGDVVLLGIDTPEGAIVQDKSRVNVVRERPGPGATPTRRSTERRVRRSMDVESGVRRVIYSLRLPHLERHEQFAARARMTTGIGHLPYSTFIGAQLVVATGRNATRPTAIAKRTVSLNGEVTEGTGFNCTQAATPCVTRKAGVLRVRRDAPMREGRPVPLFLNLVARNAPKRTDDRPGDAVRILRRGGITAVRYPAALAG